MWTFTVLLILVHYTNFMLPVEAKVCENFSNEAKTMFKSRKNPMEWEQGVFGSYYTELNQIVLRKTPDEIINEVNSRVLYRVNNCKKDDEPCVRRYLFGMFSSHTVITYTVFYLRSGLI